MIGNVITAAVVVTVILCLVLFAWFLNWRDNREMDRARTEIHYVRRGAFSNPNTSVLW